MDDLRQSGAVKAKPHIGRLLTWVAVFSVFTNLLLLTGPLFMLQVYDRVLASRSEETLVALFALVAALYLFYGTLEFARGRVAARAGGQLQSAYDRPLFEASIESHVPLQGQARSDVLNSVAIVRGFFSAPVFLALFDLPWTPLFAACIFVFHPLLGWLALAGGTLLIAVAITNQITTRKKLSAAGELTSQADRLAHQTETARDLVLAQGMHSAMIERWDQIRAAGVDQALRATDWTGSFAAMTRAFRLFLQSAVLALGAWLVLQSEITAGAMIAASILMGRALAPVEQCISNWPLVQNARNAHNIVKSVLTRAADTAPRLTLPHPEARLSVSGVTVFVSSRDAPVLREVSLTLEPGQAIGVIGKSGSGKTTLARTIVGLVRPVRGDVRLDGAALDHYGREHLGRYVGYLPQDIHLFDGSIGDNIAQMSLAPDATKIVAAAQKAGVHDIILALPQGYDTRIGAADSQLSGGQKQRVALARALYNAPEILVLDEPNSALDAEGSEALNAVVRDMKAAGKAVLIMTHRPVAISACDTLLVLERGVTKAFGPRDDIIKSMMRNSEDVHRVIRKGGAG